MDVAFKYLISEYYSRDMSMKTKSAKYAKMQRGEYQSKICPYGYRKSADGRMEPNPETAAVVQLIFQLAATGIGAAAITRELFKRGVPTPGEYKAAPWAAVPRCLTLSWPLEQFYGSPHPGGRTLYRFLRHWTAGSH